MRRALRHLFTLCSAPSLVLCVVVCVLWVRSYMVSDQVRWIDIDPGDPATIHDRHVLVGRGCVIYGVSVARTEAFYLYDLKSKLTATGQMPYLRTAPRNGLEDVSTFGFGKLPHSQGFKASAPLWFVALCFAIPAAPALVATARTIRERRRRFHGLCGRCGYNLHASPDRCPECGTAVMAPE